MWGGQKPQIKENNALECIFTETQHSVNVSKGRLNRNEGCFRTDWIMCKAPKSLRRLADRFSEVKLRLAFNPLARDSAQSVVSGRNEALKSSV